MAMPQDYWVYFNDLGHVRVKDAAIEFKELIQY